jgi:hypothetical protein
MSIAFKPLSKSTTGILSLDDAKDHLKIPLADTSQDGLIDSYISAAIQTAEDSTERKIGLSKYQFRIPAKVMEMDLPYQEFIEITKLSSLDKDLVPTLLFEKDVTGDLSTYIQPDPYTVPPMLILKEVIPVGAEYYLIEATFGMDISLIPFSIIQGIKMVLYHYYDNGSAVEVGRTANEVPLGAKSLFHVNRFMRF